MAAIGYGGIVLSKIVPRIKDDYSKAVKPQSLQIPENITRRHTRRRRYRRRHRQLPCQNGPMLQSRARRPHNRLYHARLRRVGSQGDCPNVRKNLNDPDYQSRFVSVRWADHLTGSFKASLEIVCENRFGMLADVSSSLSSMHVMINNVNARELKKRQSSHSGSS